MRFRQFVTKHELRHTWSVIPTGRPFKDSVRGVLLKSGNTTRCQTLFGGKTVGNWVIAKMLNEGLPGAQRDSVCAAAGEVDDHHHVVPSSS